MHTNRRRKKNERERVTHLFVRENKKREKDVNGVDDSMPISTIDRSTYKLDVITINTVRNRFICIFSFVIPTFTHD
jgi:hypothetical protein